jgi:hypothetical protein
MTHPPEDFFGTAASGQRSLRERLDPVLAAP